ncbi:MAG: Hpt domain-containing protein [Opitutaceae bacterium]|nr:Hpt domain-containing protein [Opitutaceae bacterium]
MSELFPDIERTLAAGDMVEARRHAHTGAGSCATCGMMQAQNVMRRMERSIEAGQSDHTRELIHEARRVLAATRAAAAELVPGLK